MCISLLSPQITWSESQVHWFFPCVALARRAVHWRAGSFKAKWAAEGRGIVIKMHNVMCESLRINLDQWCETG